MGNPFFTIPYQDSIYPESELARAGARPDHFLFRAWQKGSHTDFGYGRDTCNRGFAFHREVVTQTIRLLTPHFEAKCIDPDTCSFGFSQPRPQPILIGVYLQQGRNAEPLIAKTL